MNLNMKELEGKRLLVLGGFELACDIVNRAHELGAYVIVADYNPNLPARSIADKYELVSCLDVGALVSLCEREHIDGVATGFVDILLQPCYEVCKIMGLPCYLTPKLIMMSTNKIDFKETCLKYDVPVPKTYLIGSELTNEVYNSIKYPVFVKPLDASGSRGAGVCYNKEDLDKQFAAAVSFSVTKNALVEDYIFGKEFLLNYIAQDGEFRLISMFDRHISSDRGSAINYSNLAIGPSKAIDYYLEEINDKVVNMFKSLGFSDGIYFLQGYSNGSKITFFEMGCRLGGSYYNLEDRCIGVDPVKMLVRYALTGKMADNISSMAVDAAKYENVAICINYLLKGKEGRIARINGIDEIIAMPSYVDSEQRQFVGDHYSNDRIVDRPIFSVYTVDDDMETMKRNVSFMNDVFDALDEEGNSLLSEKFDPNEL